MNKTPCFPSLFYKQRLNAAGISMLCGVLLYLVFPAFSGIVLIVLSVLALSLSVVFKEEKRKIFLCFAFGFSLAILSTSLCQIQVQNSEKIVGKSGYAQGYVVKANRENFDLALVSFDDEPCFCKVRCEGTEGNQGEKIRVYLETIQSPSFSERSEGIDLISSTKAERKVVGKSYFFSFVAALRNGALSSFGTGETGSFLSAILLGEREGLSENVKGDFRMTASSHILAISGLHIAQFIGIFFCLTRILNLDIRFARILLYPLTLFLFFLGGAGISVFRASVMALFSATGILLRRRSDSLTSLVFSATLLVLFDPFALGNISFILSYLSTFAMVSCALPLCEHFKENVLSDLEMPNILRKISLALVSSLFVSLVVFVFLLPVMLLYFDDVQILSPLYALVLVPLFQPVLILGLFLAIFSFLPSFFGVLSYPMTHLVSLYLRLVHLLSAASFPLVSAGWLALPFAFFTGLFILWFFVRKASISRIFYLYLASFLFLILLGLFPQ